MIPHSVTGHSKNSNFELPIPKYTRIGHLWEFDEQTIIWVVRPIEKCHCVSLVHGQNPVSFATMSIPEEDKRTSASTSLPVHITKIEDHLESTGVIRNIAKPRVYDTSRSKRVGRALAG